MTRTFHHDLNIVCPGPFCQLAQTDKLLDLAYISSIRQTSGTAGIPERNGHIVLFAYIQNLIIILIEGILLACHTHPGKYQTASAADNIHFTFMFFDLINSFSGNTAVQCDKIHTVLGVHTNHINKIFCRQCGQIPLVMNNTVINRYGTDHGRTFVGQLLTEWLCVSVAGKIHDGLCAHIYGAHDLFHLDIVVLAVSGHAQIHIDLGTKHAADAFRIQTGMVFVCRNGYLTLCYQFHQRLAGHVLFLRNSLDLECCDAFSCRVHLCCVISHLYFLLFTT